MKRERPSERKRDSKQKIKKGRGKAKEKAYFRFLIGAIEESRNLFSI